MPEPERTALYRLYDTNDRLLYIGISYQPEKRFKEHASNKPWWHLVAQKEITWLASREEALSAEAAATRQERPHFDASFRFGKGQDAPKNAYDDSADVASLIEKLRAALQHGAFERGSHLWPLRVGKAFGYSTLTTSEAMAALAREGLLVSRAAGFSVPR